MAFIVGPLGAGSNVGLSGMNILKVQVAPAKAKPKRKPKTRVSKDPALVRDQALEKTTDASRYTMGNLTRYKGMIAGSLQYDTSYLTVRIRNSTVRMLRAGAIIGGGNASGCAQMLDGHFHLGCKVIYGGRIPVPAKGTPIEVIDELVGLCQADTVTSLLAQEGRRYPISRETFEFRRDNNLWLLGRGAKPNHPQQRSTSYSYNPSDLQLDNENYILMAGALVGGQRPAELVAKSNRIADAVEKGLKINFSFDYGQPIKATVVGL